MDQERWAQVKEIVNACLDVEPAVREARVEELCAGDPSLREEVESLLASQAELGEFMESGPSEPGSDELDLLTGQRIGNYEIREAIAEGGMGAVYRAVRTSDFQKQVAIKLVKRGMDTGFILRRFRHERQILAALDHPNIARLLDGGATEDGRPYLVMEYIEGTPLTEYAERRRLPPAERLKLFRIVCSAVQYAHQNLVVHRDLKPGNILVTADGAPKLLDFGISKLLESDAEVTMTSLRLMTPECASPEQVRGEPITTATDVYALGVLLYELLTGGKPYKFNTRSAEEIRRVICETDPPKPSTVQPLSEDLDNIVLKAMNKEPTRRYSSAEQLSEDIQRYLTGQPVQARKDTLRYRASKFVARHKAMTAAASLFVVSLIAGMGATLWEAHIARAERARAERRFNQVRRLANTLLFDIHDGIQDLPGSTRIRKLLVDRALEYLNSLTDEAEGDRSLQREIATAYEKVGAVQGKYGASNLGDTAGALESLQKALQIRKKLVAGNPSDNDGDHLALAAAYRLVATQLMNNGSFPAALGASREAMKIAGQLLHPTSNDRKVLEEAALDYRTLGIINGQPNRSRQEEQESLEYFRKALALDQAILTMAPADENVKRALVLDWLHVGDGQLGAGDLSGCLASYQRELELAQELASGSVSATRQRDVAVAYNRLAMWYERTGDKRRQLDAYQENRKIYIQLAAADRNNARAQWDLAAADANVGNLLLEAGQGEASLELLNQAVQIGEALGARDPGNFVQSSVLIQIYFYRAEARGRAGMNTAAVADLEKAQGLLQKRLQHNPSNGGDQVASASCQVGIGKLLLKMGSRDQALGSFRKALEISKRNASVGPNQYAALATMAGAYAGFGDDLWGRSGDKERRRQACAYYQQSMDAWRLVADPSHTDVVGFEPEDRKEVETRLKHCGPEPAELQRSGAK
jgi:tetratricopeptide (TPR) repeat protein